MERQALNVYSMRLLGAKVHPVDAGTGTLKDAVNETLPGVDRAASSDTHYVLGSVHGAHTPSPPWCATSSAVICQGDQAADAGAGGPACPTQCSPASAAAATPSAPFYNFIDDPAVRLIGCEAAGAGRGYTERHAATIATGRAGHLPRHEKLLLPGRVRADRAGVLHLRRAGLSRHRAGARLRSTTADGREYVPVTDDEAVDAFEYLARTEGIIPAIESAHAVALRQEAGADHAPEDQIIVVNLSGRGRQGRAPPSPATEGRTSMNRIRGIDTAPLQGGKAFIPFLTCGDPRPGHHRGADRGHGGGGSRPYRAGHPLLRPHRRGPGHPGGEPSGAGGAA